MRKILFLLPALLLAVTVCAAESGRELIILNWDSYLDPELVSRFEAAHNARVSQVLYASDVQRTELLLATDGKGYDLILTSGYDLAIYVRQNWVAPLDVDQVPNLRHLAPRWRQAYPHAEQYGVPFFWGTLGIAYRSDLVKTPLTRWMQFFEPAEELRGKIGMIDDARDGFAMALKALGYSANTEDIAAVERARDLLLAQKPYVSNYRYISLDEQSSLVKGEIVATMAFSGDALMVAGFNENIVYVLPEEGGNLWIDYFVVARHAKNPDLAYAFLNFINEPANAAQMAQYVNYATPNEAAEKLLDADFLANPIIYPDKRRLQNSEFYTILSPRSQRLRDIYWMELIR